MTGEFIIQTVVTALASGLAIGLLFEVAKGGIR